VLTLGPVQRKPDASAPSDATVQRVEIGEADDAKEREADVVADTVARTPEPPASAGVQRKPVIGAPGDAYEREADAVADRVSGGLDAPAFSVTRLGPAGPAGPPRAPVAAEAAAPIVPVAPVQPIQAMEEEKPEEVLPAPSVQAMEIASADQEPPPAPASSGGAGSPIQRKEKEETPDSIQLAADEEMEEAPPPPSVQAMEAAPADQEPPDEPPPPDDVPIQRKIFQRKEMDEDDPVQLDAAGPTSASAGPTSASAPVPASASTSTSAPASMNDAAAAAIASHGPGAPLPAGTRGALELRLGVDLGGVRVHDDADAHRSAAALHARAFTHGRHIWLGRGESAGDVRLMAHEVTHVLQQDGVVRRKPAEKKAPKKSGSSSGGSGDGGSAAPPPAPAPAPPAPKAEAKAPSSPDALREPQMPPPPEELSAAEKARLNKVEERADGAVDATTDLPPAEAQVGDARGAVQEPQAETKARAGDALVEALDQRPAPSPEIEQLCKDIRKAIKAKRPPDEDSLVKAKPKDMAQQAGSQMNASVEGDAQRVQGQYDQLQAPPAGTPEKTAEPLPPPPGPAETPALGAAGAAPGGVPAEKVSLDADVEAGAKQMEEAGMESEPAKLVQDGPIAEARAAQGELAETAARDPQEVLAEQKDVLAGAQNDMAALQASALASLKSGRSKTTEEGRSQQTGMVGSEEEMRTKAGADAQAIFDSAQKRVNDLLTPLPKTAMAKWEAGVKVLSTEFEQTLSKVKKWIDDRHDSTVLAVWDAVTGLPGWVTEEYDRAEEKFGEGVCALIREISTEVNGVIAACETIIDTSRKEIDGVFAALPAELQGWAAEQQASFGKQLDGLADKAQKTKSDFTRELTEKAASAVQEVRQKVHELREAAKGLLGKLADAVNAFLEDPAKFIIDGLLKLVGIAPSAFWALVDRIGQAIDAIADDPMNFVNNLMAALGKGFSQFFDNIGSHLLKGLLEWLFSGLGSVGVTIPSDLSLKSIITFFLQLMGLSWANIRKILAKHIGEKNVALIEKAWELVSMLIEKGPEGIFELVQEQLDPANLLSMVLEAATEYLITALIKAVTPRILLMFNPAGAIIQAIEAIFRVLSWVFNNAAKIFSLVETIVNGVTDLIAGNIGGMANAIETGLAKLIPPVIDFLASYLGLGDLPEAIAGVIKGFQKQVLAIVDKIIGFLAKKAADLLKKLGLGGKDEKEDEAAGDHVALAGKAKKEMEKRPADAEDYKSIRSAKEAQAKTVEDKYTKLLEPGIKLSITFAPAAADEQDEDLDFTISIAPNTTTTTGAVPVGTLVLVVDVTNAVPPGGSQVGALPAASAQVQKALPGEAGAATAFEQEVGGGLAGSLGVPVPKGKSRLPAKKGSGTGLPTSSTLLKEPKTNLGGVAKKGDLYREPDFVVLSPGGAQQVEVFEVTLDVGFELKDAVTSHKHTQIAATLFALLMRYPTAPIIYNIRAPKPPTPKALAELEAVLRDARKRSPKVEIIWRYG
jgi:hypothetical protein